MKNFIVIVAFLAANLSVFAQSLSIDSTKVKIKKIRVYNEAQFKPEKGALATELNINPFKGELSFNNSLN